jgi:hypothetical protein
MSTSTAATSRPRPSTGPAGWRLPAALTALSAVPVAAGSLRALAVAGGPLGPPTKPRTDAVPAAVVPERHRTGARTIATAGGQR